MRNRLLVVPFIVFGVGMAAGAAGMNDRKSSAHVPQAPQYTAVAGLSAPSAPGGEHGEHSSWMLVEVDPVSVSDTGDSLTVQIVLDSTAAQDAVVQYAVEIVTDRGEALTKPSLSVELPLVALDQQATVGHFTTPRIPRDGFFLLRVTIAGVSGDEDAAEVRHVYLEVENGLISVLEPDDWMARSYANEGVSR